MRHPGVAAVLSFFITGLGQVYNGQILKGALLFVVQGVNSILLLVFVGFITYPLLWFYGTFNSSTTAQLVLVSLACIAYAALWLYGIYDAYTTAQRSNRREQAREVLGIDRSVLAAGFGHEGSAAPQLSGRGVLATWMISIAAHIVLFTVMFMVPWLSEAVLNDNELPIPEAELIGEVRPASFSPADSPDLSDQTKLSDPSEANLTPKRFDQLADLAKAPERTLSVVGIGSGRADPSAFHLAGAGDGGAQFFKVGPSSGARRVVFVVDRSGSMTDTFEFVRAELKRSISAFRRTQKFHVIFFSTGRPLENPPGRLVSAIPSQKEKFFTFIDEQVYPGGSTDPGPAMLRAFESKPDVIYFLTDGEFDRSLLRKLDNANKDRRVRIFTIAYFNQQGAELLREIAREHRGEFRFVTDADLP